MTSTTSGLLTAATSATKAVAQHSGLDTDACFRRKAVEVRCGCRRRGAVERIACVGWAWAAAMLFQIPNALAQGCGSTTVAWATRQERVYPGRHGAKSAPFRSLLGITASQWLITSVTSEVGVRGDLPPGKEAAEPVTDVPVNRLAKRAPPVSYHAETHSLLVTLRRSLLGATCNQVAELLKILGAAVTGVGHWQPLDVQGTSISPDAGSLLTLPGGAIGLRLATEAQQAALTLLRAATLELFGCEQAPVDLAPAHICEVHGETDGLPRDLPPLTGRGKRGVPLCGASPGGRGGARTRGLVPRSCCARVERRRPRRRSWSGVAFSAASRAPGASSRTACSCVQVTDDPFFELGTRLLRSQPVRSGREVRGLRGNSAAAHRRPCPHANSTRTTSMSRSDQQHGPEHLPGCRPEVAGLEPLATATDPDSQHCRCGPGRHAVDTL